MMRMTLTSSSLPWDDITVPDADYNVRLVATNLSVPVYWGKDTLGQRLVIIELSGDHSREFNRADVIVQGLGIDLQAGKIAGTQRLVLVLQEALDADLFFGLCSTLLRALAPVTDSAVALSVTMAHLRRWKTFWAGRRTGILSAEQVRGLLAELAMLQRLLASGMQQTAAVHAWTGADGVQQDFVLPERAIEVKSITGRERNSVRISSEDQLETVSGKLFLVVFRVSEQPDAPEAWSLNDTVAALESGFSEAEAIEEFQARLAAAGYLPLANYDTPKYVAVVVSSYSVEDGFPRLVRSGLPQGLARVSYDIELESIAAFACAFESVLR